MTIDEILDKIEAGIRESPGTREETKAELRRLLAELRAELEGMSEADRARASHIVGLTHRATVESAGATDAAEGGAVEEVERAVQEFEAAHPRLMTAIGEFCRTLARAGL